MKNATKQVWIGCPMLMIMIIIFVTTIACNWL